MNRGDLLRYSIITSPRHTSQTWFWEWLRGWLNGRR